MTIESATTTKRDILNAVEPMRDSIAVTYFAIQLRETCQLTPSQRIGRIKRRFGPAAKLVAVTGSGDTVTYLALSNLGRLMMITRAEDHPRVKVSSGGTEIGRRFSVRYEQWDGCPNVPM